jgi:proteasome assembly chaperone (PAC2) family protein
MSDLFVLREVPDAQEIHMIAGWHQWADAGSVSSGLPPYLVELTHARRIGEIKPTGFYMFQIPRAHDLLRPKIALDDGYRKHLETKRNEFFYAGDEQKGLVLFLGEEPHLNVERYVEAFLDAAVELGVKRVVTVGGVHAPVPYDRDRQVSCAYSLPSLRAELEKYAVQFSDYEGGSSIGTYLIHRAEHRGIELVSFYVLVPFYDFMHISIRFAGIQLEEDFKAWYDLLRRFSHMFGLGLDLTSLEGKSRQLLAIVDAQINELDEEMPELQVREQIAEMTAGFEETSFMPLSDVWGRELKDLFED